jgi:L-amino acid N-acyltransferase YncA
MPYTLDEMSDLHRSEVIDIFNYFVQHSFAAYPEEPVDYAFFDYFRELSRNFPAIVAKSDQGAVVGFAFLRPFHPSKTFSRTAEVTYFIIPHHTRAGLGSLMLGELVKRARQMGIDNLLASVASLNEPSIRFHEKHGFRQCGRLPRVASKFGKDLDVVWMQLVL